MWGRVTPDGGWEPRFGGSKGWGVGAHPGLESSEVLSVHSAHAYSMPGTGPDVGKRSRSSRGPRPPRARSLAASPFTVSHDTWRAGEGLGAAGVWVEAALSRWPEREVLALVKWEGQGPRRTVMHVQRPWGPTDIWTCGHGARARGSSVDTRGGAVGLALWPRGSGRLQAAGPAGTQARGLPWPQGETGGRLDCVGSAEAPRGGGESGGGDGLDGRPPWAHLFGEDGAAEALRRAMGSCGAPSECGVREEEQGCLSALWPQGLQVEVQVQRVEADISAVLKVGFRGQQPWRHPRAVRGTFSGTAPPKAH